jgi:hypothetical protein
MREARATSGHIAESVMKSQVQSPPQRFNESQCFCYFDAPHIGDPVRSFGSKGDFVNPSCLWEESGLSAVQLFAIPACTQVGPHWAVSRLLP